MSCIATIYLKNKPLLAETQETNKNLMEVFCLGTHR